MAARGYGLKWWNIASTIVGSAAWGVVMLLRVAGAVMIDDMDDLDVLLLLAVLVVVPLVLPLAAPIGKQRAFCSHTLYRIALAVQPLAALFGGIALIAARGSAVEVVAAMIWLLFTALLGLMGLAALAGMLRYGQLRLAEACLALALVYLPIGGVWLALACLGIRLLGFDQTVMLLTAIHFHFITLVALTITGCTGLVLRTVQRDIVQPIYRAAAVGMLICPLLVAGGITFTQLTHQQRASESMAALHAPESGAAILLALSLTLIAVLDLRFAVPAAPRPLARVLLVISGSAVPLTMALAAAYAIGATTGAWTITVAQMVATHGWLNALAFGLCGLLGWRLYLARESWEVVGGTCA